MNLRRHIVGLCVPLYIHSHANPLLFAFLYKLYCKCIFPLGWPQASVSYPGVRVKRAEGKLSPPKFMKVLTTLLTSCLIVGPHLISPDAVNLNSTRMDGGFFFYMHNILSLSGSYSLELSVFSYHLIYFYVWF